MRGLFKGQMMVNIPQNKPGYGLQGKAMPLGIPMFFFWNSPEN